MRPSPDADGDRAACEGEQIIARTWTPTDTAVTRRHHIQIITVRDNTPARPSRSRPISPYTRIPPCGYDASVGITGDVTDEADNCDTSLDATFIDAVAPGTCEGEQIITRTWTLTDDCGNPTTHIRS
ncbi:MAG: hypothetical protein U5L72_04675 [Bacteroidales bacterium]|nr:hypothetical protein [Bacteroidales bacterium]